MPTENLQIITYMVPIDFEDGRGFRSLVVSAATRGLAIYMGDGRQPVGPQPMQPAPGHGILFLNGGTA